MIILAILLFIVAFYALLYRPKRRGRRPQQGNSGSENMGYANQDFSGRPENHGDHHSTHSGGSSDGGLDGHH